MDFKIGYHYRITKKIGHGTFGDIYIGSDEKKSTFIQILVIHRKRYCNQIGICYKQISTVSI